MPARSPTRSCSHTVQTTGPGSYPASGGPHLAAIVQRLHLAPPPRHLLDVAAALQRVAVPHGAAADVAARVRAVRQQVIGVGVLAEGVEGALVHLGLAAQHAQLSVRKAFL